MVALRHEGDEIVATPIDDGWRVQYRGHTVESAYLEYALAAAVGIEAKAAIAFSTQLLHDHLEAATEPSTN
jgi:hypothetical protein